jgi:CBS domain containing-hemolysin-like protein
MKKLIPDSNVSKCLEFSGVKARYYDPRTEIVAIDLFDPVDELKDLFVTNGYSKL